MKIALKYGLITGLLSCGWVLTEYVLGFHNENIEQGQYSQLFAMSIPIIMLYLGIKEYREEELKGTLSFTEGLKTGVVICLVSALITTVFMVLYQHVINPEFWNANIEYQKNKLYERGLDDDQIEISMMWMEKMYNSPFMYLIMFISSVFMGAILAMIISLILRKKSKEAA